MYFLDEGVKAFESPDINLHKDTNPELTGCYLTILKRTEDKILKYGLILDVLFP
jgi:hypothetical protein